MAPAPTAAGPVLVTLTSALTVTVADVVEVLFEGVGSAVVEVTVAVSLIVVPDAVAGEIFTVSAKVAVVPGARDAMLQDTVAPVVQAKVGPVFWTSETNVVFGGKTSVQDTLAAFDGPLLVTVIVYVMLLPAVAVAGPVLVIETSA